MEQRSQWAAGWIAFAAAMMLLMGVWWVIAGLVALIDDNFYEVGNEWVFQFDLTTWGWIHLVLGVIVAAAGIGLFAGQLWARVVGVVMAVIVAIIAFAWLPWYPIWAVIFIAVSVAVIWALTAHGEDLAEV